MNNTINIVETLEGKIEIRTQSLLKGDIVLVSYACEDNVSWTQKMESLKKEFKTLSNNELIEKYNMESFKLSLNSLCVNGVRYINTTPHPINFGTDDGRVITLPCSGHLINAQAQEVTVKVAKGIEYVRTQFIKNSEGVQLLNKIKEVYPNAIIVGSIIAAQAYPGEVVALTPCVGYERVAPSEKRMNLNKFTIF